MTEPGGNPGENIPEDIPGGPPPAPPKLSPAQADSILDSTGRINLWEGSIRSGKTIASIIAWLLFVRTGPAGPLAIIGKTRETVGRNVLDVIADLIPDAIVWTRGAATCLILGRLVHVLGANDAKSESKLRGLTLAGAYVDEATTIPEQFWVQLTGRLSIPRSRLFATTNPDGPAHWLRTDWIDRADETPELGMRLFHFTLDDNPALDPAFVASIKAGFVGLWYRRFILGEWVAAEGAIYEMLDPAVHHRAARPATDADRLWVGIDYGTANPTHAVLLGLFDDDTDHGNLQVLSEWRHDGRSAGRLIDPTLSRHLTSWLLTLGLRKEDVDPVLDPSAASFHAQLLVDGWARLKSADNRVLTGIRSVATLLEPRPGRGPILTIDTARSPELWKELTGYVWDPAAQNAGRDEPLKVNEHGADATRYAVMAARRFWRRWVTVLDTADVDLDDYA